MHVLLAQSNVRCHRAYCSHVGLCLLALGPQQGSEHYDHSDRIQASLSINAGVFSSRVEHIGMPNEMYHSSLDQEPFTLIDSHPKPFLQLLSIIVPKQHKHIEAGPRERKALPF